MSDAAKLSYLVPRNPSIKCWNDRVKLSNPVLENVVKLGLDACEESSNEKLKVYLRIKPCQVEVNPYSVFNNTLEAEAPGDNAAGKKQSRNIGKLVNKFHFTTIFGPDSPQECVFETCVLSNLKRFIGGHNDLLFAYGTTNAGKTFTMQGTVENPGMIPRAMQFLFKCLEKKIEGISRYQPFRYNELCLLDDEELRKGLVHKNFILNLNLVKYQRNPEMSWKSYKTDTTTSNSDYSISYVNETFREMEKNLDDVKYEVDDHRYSVWISMIEIYNEQIYDLLEVPSERNLRIKLGFAEDENGKVYIKNLRYVRVTNGHEAFQVFEFGRANLRLGPTALNYWSSRSHCICTLTLARFSPTGNPSCVTLSRFSFCDLAGAERVKKALVEGNRLVESKSINTSLSIFAKCLSVIRENQTTGEKRMVPYRESKLTRLFRDAMMGKETFSIIVNITPEIHLFNETLNVLKFSAVARQIVPVNVVQKPKRMRALEQGKFAAAVSNMGGNCKIDWEADEVIEMKEDEKVVEFEDLMRLIEYLKMQVSEERERADTIESRMKKEYEAKFSEMLEQIEEERNLFKCENKRIRGVFDREKERLMKRYEERERKLKRKRMEEDISDYEEMETRIETLTRDMELLKSENVSLKEVIQQMNAKCNVMQKKFSQLQFELSEKDRMLKIYKRMVEEGDAGSEEVVKELESQLLQTKSKNAELKELLDESAFEYKDLLVTNNIIKEENVRLLSDLATTSNVVDDLKKELRECETMLSAKTKKLVELESKLDESSTEIFVECHINKDNKVYEVVDVYDTQDDVENGEVEGNEDSSDEGQGSGTENSDDEYWTTKSDGKDINVSPVGRQNEELALSGSGTSKVDLEGVVELLKKEIADERERAENIENRVRKELETKFAEIIEELIQKERNLFEGEKRRIGETFDRKKTKMTECYEEKIRSLTSMCSQQTETIKSLNEELQQLTDKMAEKDREDEQKYKEVTERNRALMEEVDRFKTEKARLGKLLEKNDLEKDKRSNLPFLSRLLKKLEGAGLQSDAITDGSDQQMDALEERIMKLLEEGEINKRELESLRNGHETIKKSAAFKFELIIPPHEASRDETVRVEELTDNLGEVKVNNELPAETKDDAEEEEVRSDSGLSSEITEKSTPERLSREIEKLSILRTEPKKSCRKAHVIDKAIHPSLVKIEKLKSKKKEKREPETEAVEDDSKECKIGDSCTKGKKGKKCTKKLFVENDFDDIGDLESSFMEPEIPRLRPRKK